ncbi:hypothetical protein GCM10029963_11510 [Micromonospora andamanensis]
MSRGPCVTPGGGAPAGSIPAVSVRFEELAWRPTPIGEISLRRRRDPRLDLDVYEVKLDDEFLMSSLFTAGEIELARLGLAPLAGDRLDVVVGGLGLGYTARTALADDRVASLLVVEAVEDVIDWHRRGLLPFAAGLAEDPRTRLVPADFFARVAGPDGLDPDDPERRFHAVLLDIDHSPGIRCIRATPRSTGPRGCAGWRGCCIRAGCSPSGRTTHRTGTSKPTWPPCSPPTTATWCGSPTRSPAASRRTPSIWGSSRSEPERAPGWTA